MISAPRVIEHRFTPRGNSSRLFEDVLDAQDAPADEPLEILWEGPAGAGGKTTCSLHLINMLCELYPGLRVLMARDVKADLASSVLRSFEGKVLPPGHPLLSGKDPKTRSNYQYDNGSTIDLMGYSDSTRFRSGEWDVLYVCEASQISLTEWEDSVSRLRNGVLPQPVAIAETNPDMPMHWLNQRANDGQMRRLVGRYEDNPFFWEDGEWTKRGRQYVLGTLDKLTGVRYLRLRLGQWAAAEGLIYDGFDYDLHMIGREKVPGYKADAKPGESPWGFEWTFVTVDWGIRNPGVMQVWGVDRDDRIYRVMEIYRTGEVADWWADRAEEVYKEFNPIEFVCDTDRPETIKKFNERLTPMRGRSLAPIARPVSKKSSGTKGWVLDGIDLVRERMIPDASGKPAIMFVRGVNRFIDEGLRAAKKPYCTEHEIPGYVWVEAIDGRPIREIPDPTVPDHGCDCTRYAADYKWGRDFRARVEPKRIVTLKSSIGDIFGIEEELGP